MVLSIPKGLTTKQDVVTRWWSTYAMCTRLNLLKSSFVALEQVEGGIFFPVEHRLTAEEWGIIELAEIVLEPLMFAQKILEGELYVTNSLVGPICYELRNHFNLALEHQQAQVAANPNAENIILCLQKMIDAFEERFGNGTNVIPIDTPYGNAVEGNRRQPRGLTLYQCIASALDVRTKDLFWLPPIEHEVLWDAVSKMAMCLATEGHTGLLGRLGDTAFTAADPLVGLAVPTPVLEPAPMELATASGAAAPLEFNRGNFVQPSIPNLFFNDHVTAEVNMYRAIAHDKNLRSDTLDWWRKHHRNFPLLAEVARLVLAVPATSAPSERMWSEAGLVVRSKRATLSGENVAMIVFTRAVFHFQDRYKIIL
jgi:zinc finger BED domain-containing protein 1 (E3 SUMO-protein ligase ZBED1)